MTDAQLAGRGERLAAALIDALIASAVYIPIAFATGILSAVWHHQATIGMLASSALLGFVVFVLVQAWPLAETAQTWGKRAMGIRIVMLDGTQPTLATLLFKRYLPWQAVSALPGIGSLASLVNCLMIFRSDRRCGHDLIAGTRVVQA
ncbi:MAG TPA: RDD family protein [Lysobacter sp.]|nr:RDD family protein [Lysobacter sp.]